MSRGYYLTAEPVGRCSCHDCTCDGCRDCREPDEPPTAPAPTSPNTYDPDPWGTAS